MVHMDKAPRLHAVSLQQISRIVEVTDALGLNRERVEIPLSPESPGVARCLPNGKIEIIAGAEQLYGQWLTLLPTDIQQAQRP